MFWVVVVLLALHVLHERQPLFAYVDVDFELVLRLGGSLLLVSHILLDPEQWQPGLARVESQNLKEAFGFVFEVFPPLVKLIREVVIVN